MDHYDRNLWGHGRAHHHLDNLEANVRTRIERVAGMRLRLEGTATHGLVAQ